MKFKVVATRKVRYEFYWDAESLAEAKKAITRLVRDENGGGSDLRDYAYEGNVIDDGFTAKVE